MWEVADEQKREELGRFVADEILLLVSGQRLELFIKMKDTNYAFSIINNTHKSIYTSSLLK